MCYVSALGQFSHASSVHLDSTVARALFTDELCLGDPVLRSTLADSALFTLSVRTPFLSSLLLHLPPSACSSS